MSPSSLTAFIDQFRIPGSRSARVLEFASVLMPPATRMAGAGIQFLTTILIARYRTASAFVFPSLYEGFGLPPLEAMACGCPVILSRAASLPEVGGAPFEPSDPVSAGAALYFDPQSESDLAAAIERFLSLDATQVARMRTNAIARSTVFSWDEVAGHTATLIDSIS